MTEAVGPTITIDDLWVLYGRRPQAALADVRRRCAAGEAPPAIAAATGRMPAVSGISLQVPAGSLFVVMGLSGSGKSTLLRTINRLVTPTAGRLTVGTTDVTALDVAALRRYRSSATAMVFQNFGLLPHRNALDNVAFPLRLQGQSASAARAAAAAWLDRLGLGPAARAAVATLSAGMKQRVGLARALVTGAPVLLMDEPFGALDPITRRAMQDELKGLQRDLGKTVVLITHDPREAIGLADYIAVLRAGRIVQVGTPQALRDAPANEHVAALLASAA